VSILLIRHGETALNAARVLQPADTPLSALGVVQALAVARRLAGERIGAILSSDLPRAQATADAIGAACRIEVRIDPRLQERNFGTLRGHPIDGLDHDPLALDEAPPGGESMADFQARVADVFRSIVALRGSLGDPSLAVVTHGLVIGTILRRHADPGSIDLAALRVGNASVSSLQAGAPHTIELLACVGHLAQPDSAAERAAHVI
jgi:probable phosphoglycerate mutase